MLLNEDIVETKIKFLVKYFKSKLKRDIKNRLKEIIGGIKIMDIIKEIFEVTSKETEKEYNGAYIYDKLTRTTNAYLIAFSNTIIDNFGMLTQEEAQELSKEISEYIKTEAFKVALKAKQVEILSDITYDLIATLNEMLLVPSNTLEVFDYLLMYKEATAKGTDIEDTYHSFIKGMVKWSM